MNHIIEKSKIPVYMVFLRNVVIATTVLIAAVSAGAYFINEVVNLVFG